MNTSTPKRIVVVGATSLIAEHCARLWALQGHVHFVLVSRDTARTESIAADLKARGVNNTVEIETLSFLDPNAIELLASRVCTDGTPDVVLIAHGSLPDQLACQDNLSLAHQALMINGVSPALFAEAFARRITTPAKIIILGSVAGDRGRKSNYIYGAAKGLLSRYAEGMDHRLAKSNVKVVLVKPGPTDTPMTAHLKTQGARLASPEAVAQCIVKGATRNQRVIYAPAKWQLIMMVIRHLPRIIFNKLDI